MDMDNPPYKHRVIINTESWRSFTGNHVNERGGSG
jgi:hypothetical protein